MKCCGRCCTRFTIPYSPRELKNFAALGSHPDFTYASRNFIYLGFQFKDGNGRRGTVRAHWYTCRQFDRETRLCKDYENRPKLCRIYGEHGTCKYDGCPSNKGKGENYLKDLSKIDKVQTAVAKHPMEGISPRMMALRDRSGDVRIKSHLVSFLYELMRDHLPPGVVEGIMLNCNDPDVRYCNGWLAQYAKDIAKRLRDNEKLETLHKHAFTLIGPQTGTEGDKDEPLWEWCYRCGAMKLGDEIYAPGPKQTENLTLVTDMVAHKKGEKK